MHKVSCNLSRALGTAESKQDVLSFNALKKQRLLEKLKTESEELETILAFPSPLQKISDLEALISETQEKCLSEEQYTKVLKNMEKRILASNKEYKIQLETLQRQEQNLLNRLDKGKEVIFEAISNIKEDQHKVTYIRSSLTAVRSSRKHEMNKHLLKAQKSANQIYNSCKFNDNTANGITEEEAKVLEEHKEILKKLTRISIGTENRKKEIDENLSNLTNLFRTLGMPDLNDCLTEYEQVVITNNSLSRKTEVLLKDISQLERQISKLSSQAGFPYKKQSQTPNSKNFKPVQAPKYSQLVNSTSELLKDLNLKLKKVANLECDQNQEIFAQFISNFTEIEQRLMKRVKEDQEISQDVEVLNSHVYIKEKEPKVNEVESLDPDVIYTDNKHGYIADLQDSAIQVEREAKKIIKKENKKEVRVLTPLVGVEESEQVEEMHLNEEEKTQNLRKSLVVNTQAQFEKIFDKNMKRVSSQNAQFRKKKEGNFKNAKFYCQDMLIQQRKWSQTPKSIVVQPITKSHSFIKTIKSLPRLNTIRPKSKTFKTFPTSDDYKKLQQFYRS